MKMDYSKVTENVSYSDCENCIHQFGKNDECMDCNYYNDCIVEMEIERFERNQSEKLERFFDRLENEEYPL